MLTVHGPPVFTFQMKNYLFDFWCHIEENKMALRYRKVLYCMKDNFKSKKYIWILGSWSFFLEKNYWVCFSLMDPSLTIILFMWLWITQVHILLTSLISSRFSHSKSIEFVLGTVIWISKVLDWYWISICLRVLKNIIFYTQKWMAIKNFTCETFIMKQLLMHIN